MTPRLPASLRLPVAAVLALSLSLSLSGCISLLPKTKPSQLYRFGLRGETSAPAEGAPTATGTPAKVGVLRIGGLFQREAAGDRILTVSGEKAAYIAQARWVAPAEVLFDEAVANAFDATPGPVRLVSRGEPAHSDYALRLDVRNFETDYGGRRPSVLVRVRAVLTRDQNREQVAERIFEARVGADENRLGAIVAAYDRALAQVLKDVVAWTDASAT